MSSSVEICNSALTLLGDQEITAVKDNPYCNRFYLPTKWAVLRAHPWGCAKERQKLARVAVAPLFGFSHAFTLPTDPLCLRVLEADGDPIYKIEGKKLLTDVSSITIQYIADIDEGLMDPLLEQAFVIRLCCSLAYPITHKGDLTMNYWKLYEGILQEARTVDSMEGSQDTVISDSLTIVR